MATPFFFKEFNLLRRINATLPEVHNVSNHNMRLTCLQYFNFNNFIGEIYSINTFSAFISFLKRNSKSVGRIFINNHGQSDEKLIEKVILENTDFY